MDESIPCFVGLEESTLAYLNQNRLTTSDVLTTTVTVERKIVPQTNLQSLQDRQLKEKRLKLPPPTAPMTLPVPRKRMNKLLADEKEAFMRELMVDRANREKLETWASTKIQAAFRSFCCRPKAVLSYERKQRTNVIATIRRDLMDMQRLLLHTPYDLNHPSGLPTWRQDVNTQAMSKREAKHRKDRLANAATKIQSVVKRFLARVCFFHLLSRHFDEMLILSTIIIQAAYRGYVVRKQLALQMTILRYQSIVRIQCVVRGVLARERVAILKMERKATLYELQEQPNNFGCPIPQLKQQTTDSKQRLRQRQALVQVHRISHERLNIRRKSVEMSESFDEARKVSLGTFNEMKAALKYSGRGKKITRRRLSHFVVLQSSQEQPLGSLTSASSIEVEKSHRVSTTLDLFNEVGTAPTSVDSTKTSTLPPKAIKDGPLYDDITLYQMYKEELTKQNGHHRRQTQFESNSEQAKRSAVSKVSLVF
ncbi:hypothetical protein THRCLA_22027 [Thraustotheca clavata]|uniref:Uncharacterized protein n=1 Tax=Thraustotheca clavata TaxID=74557 RepID=A0A1V9ZDJ1_9STRA|nr:hypothetical protein THRCLA_22027 [Thraustotheca clavata]